MTIASEQAAIRTDAEQRLTHLRAKWLRLKRGDLEDPLEIGELALVESQIRQGMAALAEVEALEKEGQAT